MSSQAQVGVTGYIYPPTRDAQDWTRRLKEQRLYTSYSVAGRDMSPPWMKFGNDVRISYDFGHLICPTGVSSCKGKTFSGSLP